MSQLYPELANTLNLIYGQYQGSINLHTTKLAEKQLTLSTIQAEIDRIKQNSETELSFLKKKLTDLSINICSQEGHILLEKKMEQEISEAQFLLEDQKNREKVQLEAIQNEIQQKQGELDKLKNTYDNQIQELMTEINEKEMLVGELSGGHNSYEED